MGRVRGAVNARALSLARKAVDLCNCWRREAAAECLVEKQVELVSFAEDPVMVVATLRLDVALAGGVVERTLTTLTYIPGGGLLTAFAMRSDPKGFSGLVHH